jgi:hypothetical protein
MIDTRVGPLDYETVVRGYMRYRELLMRDPASAVWDPDDPDQAAYDALEEAVAHAAPAVAWELLLTLLRRAPDEELDNFAAGPLEDVVRTRAPALIDAIEAEAGRDPRFRWALGCIWLGRGDMPDDILTRVVQASGGEIEVLPPMEELERRWPGPDGAAPGTE